MKSFKSRRGFLASLVSTIGTGSFAFFSFFKKSNEVVMETNKYRKIKHIIKKGDKHWVGNGFHVQSMFHPSSPLYADTNPFLLLDYAAPKYFSPTRSKLGVGEHPHRGFETVTFAFKGEVEHRDSAGGGGVIGTGDVQWMSAASGLVHEEFHSAEFARKGGEFEMVQLWVNLPAKDKMKKPRYQGVKEKEFPVVDNDGCRVKVVAGEYRDEKGPCHTFSRINLFEIKIEEGKSFSVNLPKSDNVIILVRNGLLSVDSQVLVGSEMAILDNKESIVRLEAKKDTEILFMSGDPINEPKIAYGPFVMNTKEEIVQAFNDYQSGKMGRL